MSDPSTHEDPTRCDQYRDLLEAWAEWWNNVGRYHYEWHLLPPITKTGEALSCLACHNAGPFEDGPDRCQSCGRRLH
jgi:hypothetical protein